MNTICFYAVPKFSDSGLKPEVFYKLDGFASADNPLSRFAVPVSSTREIWFMLSGMLAKSALHLMMLW